MKKSTLLKHFWNFLFWRNLWLFILLLVFFTVVLFFIPDVLADSSSLKKFSLSVRKQAVNSMEEILHLYAQNINYMKAALEPSDLDIHRTEALKKVIVLVSNNFELLHNDIKSFQKIMSLVHELYVTNDISLIDDNLSKMEEVIKDLTDRMSKRDTFVKKSTALSFFGVLTVRSSNLTGNCYYKS